MIDKAVGFKLNPIFDPYTNSINFLITAKCVPNLLALLEQPFAFPTPILQGNNDFVFIFSSFLYDFYSRG